jgi:hypothetical protein
LKRKLSKKLVLSRETLGHLHQGELSQAKGGYTPYTCQAPPACEYSGAQYSCPTCNLTCTTNRC